LKAELLEDLLLVLGKSGVSSKEKSSADESPKHF
jgi:hypothetical protein